MGYQIWDTGHRTREASKEEYTKLDESESILSGRVSRHNCRHQRRLLPASVSLETPSGDDDVKHKRSLEVSTSVGAVMV